MRLVLPALALLALACALLALPARADPGIEAPDLLKDRGPIRIDSDADFDAAHGVVGGNGTASDPYLIANWRIPFDGVHVRIANTSKAFVLRNLMLIGTCTPHNGTDCALEAGVYAQNASAPEIVHCTVIGMDRSGIFVDEGSDDAELVDNVVQGGGAYNGGTGILVKDSTDAVVQGNLVLAVGPPGANLASAAVRMWNATRGLVQDNVVQNATEAGISVLASHHVTLVDNEVRGNRVGVTYQGYEGLVWYNNITDSRTYGLVLTKPWVHIERNQITDNQRGVEMAEAANATVIWNNIERNVEVGLHLNDDAEANATEDWWGAGDGPRGLGTGSGDVANVTNADPGQLLFRPFLTSRLPDTGRHAPRPFASIVVGQPGGNGTSLPGVTDHTPRAIFEGPGEAYLDQPVAWSAARSVDPDGGPLRYAWDLGDGTTSAGLRVTHVYRAEGEYIVTLTVTDDQDLSTSSKLRVEVSRQPLGVFLLLSDRQVERGAPFGMRAILTGTPLGNVTYRWALQGPGSFGPPTTADVLRGQFAEPGMHLLGVIASAGNESASSFDQVKVLNAPPVANATVSPAEGDTSTDFAFDASASSDPDHDNLTFTWDWGDGTTSTGAQATHRFAAPQTQVVQLTASDGYAANTTQLVVQVSPGPAPQAPKPAPGAEPVLGLLACAAVALARRRAARGR